MFFAELLLSIAGIAYFVYMLLWASVDSNVLLWLKTKFGAPISTLKGEVVWITGASSGIGRALAVHLARNGVRLVLSARRLPELQVVKQQCLAAAHGQLSDDDVLVLQMDMLEVQKHQSLFEQVIAHFGRLDKLVNNAGRSQRAAWEDIHIQVDRDLFELDVFAVMNLSRIAVRYFMEKTGGHGHIAATSSIAGIGYVPFSATYCAAKHALNAYLTTLVMEHPSINVTIFAPGPTSTEFLQEAFTAVPEGKVGGSTANQKRMTSERCGELFAVALANKLELCWCAIFPVNFLAYAMQNFFMLQIIRRMMGRGTLGKIREGKL